MAEPRNELSPPLTIDRQMLGLKAILTYYKDYICPGGGIGRRASFRD